jgi:(2Fe-2S) ferredoxin
VAASLEAELQNKGLTDQVEIMKTGCHGYCERGPMSVIHPEEISYFQIQPEDAPEIVSETIQGKKVIDRLLYADPETKEHIVKESEIPFYKHQKRLVFGSNGSIDPKSIDDYLAIGGYAALKKALYDMSPEGVLEEVNNPT